jgi:hypothetical protein
VDSKVQDQNERARKWHSAPVALLSTITPLHLCDSNKLVDQEADVAKIERDEGQRLLMRAYEPRIVKKPISQSSSHLLSSNDSWKLSMLTTTGRLVKSHDCYFLACCRSHTAIARRAHSPDAIKLRASGMPRKRRVSKMFLRLTPT